MKRRQPTTTTTLSLGSPGRVVAFENGGAKVVENGHEETDLHRKAKKRKRDGVSCTSSTNQHSRQKAKDVFMVLVVIAAFLHICYVFLHDKNKFSTGYYNSIVTAGSSATSSTTSATKEVEPNNNNSGDGIFIAVKTTHNNRDRVSSILDTWYNFAPNDIAFFTDNAPPDKREEEQHRNIRVHVTAGKPVQITKSSWPTRRMSDPMLGKPTRRQFNLIDTECSSEHDSEGLCCKTAAEIQYFHGLISNNPAVNDDGGGGGRYRWLCHMDDDTFLNYPALRQYLANMEAEDEGNDGKLGDHFVGYSTTTFEVNKGGREALGNKGAFSTKVGGGRKEKSVIIRPIITGVGAKSKRRVDESTGIVIHEVQYGTGGAGWCLSAPLVKRGIANFANLVETCLDVHFSDDVTMGYVVQVELGVEMKKERRLHSHIDSQSFQSKGEAMHQLTFGSGYKNKQVKKVMPGRKIHTTNTRELSFVEYPGFQLQVHVNKDTKKPRDDDPMGFRALYCDFWPDKCS